MREEGKITGIGCGALVVAMVLAVLVSYGVWQLRVNTADHFGRGNAQMTVQSAPMQISLYNRFYALCVSVQNAESSIDSTLAMSDSDRKEYNLAALQQTRMRGINTYNAEALQNESIGRGQFLASNLPYQLSTAPYNGENKTQCAT